MESCISYFCDLPFIGILSHQDQAVTIRSTCLCEIFAFLHWHIQYIKNEKLMNIVYIFASEPQHDKTNKMACAHSEDSDQPGHLPSLMSLRCLHEESLGP